jgi:FixJ family two-component response regulator
MGAYEHESLRIAELSRLERQILKEKAKGLSDLEVASRLFLYEREVRAITQKLKRRYMNGKITDPPYSQDAANGPTRTRSR